MPERDDSKKDARITVRLTDTQRADLKAAAEKRDRTVNWLTRHIITDWLSKRRPRRKK